ncbi:MAG: hypothetical protein JJU34_15290 [Lunatimonas sp.]|uniref:hypothetical protein n=1 Tax=Lunatimonas sp. TaxID=2060141 RepID=UPI00263AC6C8|nr:hypothetical protein [Lunatimonas sp.]MCC5938644.1 hypothetical protein [Lunatimonas sp.]
MRITIYAEPDVFENVLLFQEDYPNWSFLFKYHTDICLNISDEEYETLLKENNELILSYIAITGGREPLPLRDFFNEIYDLPEETIEEKPRDIFFLKLSKEDAADLSERIGVLVLSADDFNDKVLNLSFFKELEEGQVWENGASIGWHELFRLDAKPINSMVLVDEYIFENTQKVKGQIVHIGEENMIQLLDKTLPQIILVPFHFTLITKYESENEDELSAFATKIIIRIKALRKYEILCEIVFQKSELFHNRKLIINYANAACERGFCVFNPANMKEVRKINDFRLNQWFHALLESKGDLEFQSSFIRLKIVKKFSRDLVDGKYQGFVFGDCKTDKTLINRLVNSV